MVKFSDDKASIENLMLPNEVNQIAEETQQKEDPRIFRLSFSKQTPNRPSSRDAKQNNLVTASSPLLDAYTMTDSNQVQCEYVRVKPLSEDSEKAFYISRIDSLYDSKRFPN